jgi:hypothetical protein
LYFNNLLPRRFNGRRKASLDVEGERRQRDGIGLYPVPLTAAEVDVLIALGWLAEGSEADRSLVGSAVAAALRELARARKDD